MSCVNFPPPCSPRTVTGNLVMLTASMQEAQWRSSLTFYLCCVDVLLPNRMKHLSYFAPPRFRGRLSSARARATFRARVVICIPAPRIPRKSILPSKSKQGTADEQRIIWIKTKHFRLVLLRLHLGIHCAAPGEHRCALAFNRVSQEGSRSTTARAAEARRGPTLNINRRLNAGAPFSGMTLPKVRSGWFIGPRG